MTQDNPYERKMPLDVRDRYRKAASLVWTLKRLVVSVLAVFGAVTIVNSVIADESSGAVEQHAELVATGASLQEEIIPPVDSTTTTVQIEPTTTLSEPVLTTTTEPPTAVVESTSTSTTTMSGSSTSTTTTTTTTTLPPLKELTAVELPPTKTVLVRVSWQAERPRLPGDGGGFDYMHGSTAEGVIISALSAESMSVTTNQQERRYEITINDAPAVSYALWSLSGCRIGWTGNPAGEIQGECPGFHEPNPGETSPGKVREEWKSGLFYPWFSRSSCIGDSDVNVSTQTRLAIQRQFAQVHGIDESLVRVSPVPVPTEPNLSFEIPKEIEWPPGQTVSIEGYEFEVLGGGNPCHQWPGA